MALTSGPRIKPGRQPRKAAIHTDGVRRPQYWRLICDEIGDIVVKNTGPIMRYIDHILQPGEKVMHSTTIHWIVYLPGIAMLVIAAIAAALSHATAFLLPVAGICAVVALLLLFGAWFRRWTTEIDVTDRRIVYKRGFIRRHTVEMNMDKVESVDVDQSIMGRLLNYGDVIVRGVGVGLEPLYNVDAPLEFRNHVTAR